MRGYIFAGMALMTLFVAFSMFIVIKGGSITGYSVLDSTKSYDIPFYISSFMILTVLLIFSIIIIVGLNTHASKNRIDEEEVVERVFRRYK